MHFHLRSCDLGAAFCNANVCRRPGSTAPPAPVFMPGQQPPAPAPAPAPAPPTPPPPAPPAPAPAPGPEPAPALNLEPVEEEPNQDQGGDNGGDEDDNGDPAPDSNVLEPTAYDDLLECGPRRVRKEIRDMTDDEWNRFVNAVRQLMETPSRRDPNRNQFEDLAMIHRESVVEAHGGSYFVTWHRLFLLLFENLLRQIDGQVVLPYWNWAVDSGDAAMSPIWNRIGGGARTAQGTPACIPNGPFAGIWSNNPNGHCVTRSFFSFRSGSMIVLDNWLTIQALQERDVTFPNFAAALESSHGSPHVAVGGDMSILGTAPNDPLFYLHHAFVDKIYLRWQHNGHGIPGRFGGSNPGVNGQVRRDSRMRAFERSVRHAQTLDCIEYEEFSGTFGLNSGALNLTVAKLPEDFIVTNHINQTRVDEGNQVLQESLDAALHGE